METNENIHLNIDLNEMTEEQLKHAIFVAQELLNVGKSKILSLKLLLVFITMMSIISVYILLGVKSGWEAVWFSFLLYLYTRQVRAVFTDLPDHKCFVERIKRDIQEFELILKQRQTNITEN